MKGKDIEPGDVFTLDKATYMVRDKSLTRHTITLAAGRTDPGFNIYLDPEKEYEVYRTETEYH